MAQMWEQVVAAEAPAQLPWPYVVRNTFIDVLRTEPAPRLSTSCPPSLANRAKPYSNTAARRSGQAEAAEPGRVGADQCEPEAFESSGTRTPTASFGGLETRSPTATPWQSSQSDRSASPPFDRTSGVEASTLALRSDRAVCQSPQDTPTRVVREGQGRGDHGWTPPTIVATARDLAGRFGAPVGDGGPRERAMTAAILAGPTSEAVAQRAAAPVTRATGGEP
eukprot:CAMPEP_0170274968 /NCGR_PEP_ID=MMETSP0116_2-20130129/37458_1 /TAXON_ID=400756 /ORGANISM="Durinskia baltica, Strain CSIRO CS-38" /LENGTH=222 /DNA_ID=CAMNT_0010526219 /DNA_START=54 /DNA_END=719 /DNA_ORIENTATION=+